ncbi:MAG: hypothetical protein Q8K75_01340 [Chlamydiales bacterium]|nr:hypothetical protein [Chlamydiales bacterium]
MIVEIITLYCICGDLLKALGYTDDPRCKWVAEVMTLVAALYFGGNIQQDTFPLIL